MVERSDVQSKKQELIEESRVEGRWGENGEKSVRSRKFGF